MSVPRGVLVFLRCVAGLVVAGAGAFCLAADVRTAAKHVSLLDKVAEATDSKPVLVYFKSKFPSGPGLEFDTGVMGHRNFLAFANSYSLRPLSVTVDLDPRTPPAQDQLEVAKELGLDLTAKSGTASSELPALFLVRGLSQVIRFQIDLQKAKAGPGPLIEQIKNALVPLANPPLASLPASGMIVAYGKNIGFAWDRTPSPPPQIFARENPAASATDPGIASLAIGHNGSQYYVATTTKRHSRSSICRSDRSGNQTLFTTSPIGGAVDPMVRDIALNEADQVFFSQTRDGNGFIARLVRRSDENAWRAEPFYMNYGVDLPEWAGRFAFGRTADGKIDTNTLFLLSQGYVHRTYCKDGVWLSPQRITSPPKMHASAIVATGPEDFFVASGNQIWHLDARGHWSVALTLPSDLSGLIMAP